jgi:DNA-binding SARP family transcriptional activator
MEFRILGPLEASDGDRAVPLSGARQRALLAVLLLNANRVVSGDRLIDAIWGEEPPESGATALQVRVSQLRKALGAGGSLLVTRAPGYAIQLGRDQLDLHRFERLVCEADGAESVVAAEKLREALALWRGPALADFSYASFAQAAIGRLEELRLAALERRIEADLALGRHALLVGELEELVSEHPLRERLRGQLMLALYRSGRHAEALEAYQRARRMLVDELGIEPSPALQELETAILRQDPVLELGTAVGPGRSILVAAREEANIDALLALAEPLARRPPRELIVARLLAGRAGLPAAAAFLESRRERLLAAGIAARAAAFTSAGPAADAVRIAVEQDVELLLLDAPAELLEDAELNAVLRDAPCDVGVLVGGEPTRGPVLVPFAGAEHDWSAVELGAWIAGGWDVPLRLAGPALPGGKDASRLLADASLAVQRAHEIAAEPLLVEPGTDGLALAAEDAGLVIVGLSDRWRKDGLGPVRSAVAAGRAPVLLVRRGLRPGGLAPREALTRFTWSLGPTSA